MELPNGFNVTIETASGFEAVDLYRDLPGFFIVSSLLYELQRHRAPEPDEAYYQMVPYVLSGGPLYMNCTEFDLDSECPSVEVKFMFDAEQQPLPVMHPVDSRVGESFSRGYAHKIFTHQDLDDLKEVAIKRHAKTN